MIAADAGPVACPVREFPIWQVSIRPAGVACCGAYWESQDGRHRRYLVAAVPEGLLALLRERAIVEQHGRP